MTQDSILFFENCGHSPAWQLIPAAMRELNDTGRDFQPSQPPVWNDPCLTYANQGGLITGFLVYRYDPIKSSWFILLSFVLPAERRKGVHTALFTGLVARAKERGDILSIDSGTHTENLAAQAAFEAQGRKKTAIMYEYRIRDWLAGKPHLQVSDTPAAGERVMEK